MNLGEGWIGEERASFVGAIRRCHIAATRVGRKVEHVSVATAGESDGICRVPLRSSRTHSSSDNSLGLAVDNHHVEHLRVWKHPHRAGSDLAAQGLVTA